jgi:replicative superfamily II helicase
LITRQNAILQGLPRYFTGKPCKHGHISERYTNNKTCCVCGNQSANKAKDPIKVREYNRTWRHNNPEKSLGYTQKYLQNNKDKRNLWTANYREAKRTPAWLTEIDHERIANVYKLATLQSKITGVPWHVDHIIPLRGKYVSGLHVPSNLQAIPGVDNVRKNNSYGI